MSARRRGRQPQRPESLTSSTMSAWGVELEPEVREWIESLAVAAFATVAFHIDRIGEQGSRLRMPHSRALGEGLFELRFDLDRTAQRISYFFPGAARIVLLTVFRKQRDNERREVARARMAMARCVREAHDAEEG